MQSQLKPALLVTTAPNKGTLCAIEIANRIMIRDPLVKITEEVQNVLVVYSVLQSRICYGLVVSAPPACARKIFPIHAVARPDYGAVISEAKRLLNETNARTLYVDCYNRGGRLSCRTLEMAIGGSVSGIAKIDSRTPEVRCVVNVLKDSVMISILKKDEEKLSVRSLP